VLVDLNENDQMVNMLRAGRLDGFIVEDGIVQMQIRASTFPMQRFVIEEQKGDPLHYIFALKTPDAVVQRFNAAILKRQTETK
jgi:ABC-type amino acid transport substrate-binding protein